MKALMVKTGSILSGVGIIFAMFILLGAVATAEDDKEPSAVENAVINCNSDNVLGHGGSVQTPPECEEEEAESVSEDGWVSFVDESKVECIEAEAEAALRASAISVGQDETFQEDAGGKSIDVAGSACVRVRISIEGRGSAAVK